MKRISRKHRTLLMTASILALFIGSYGYAVATKDVLDDEARRSAHGRFVSLSMGKVHYELAGPEQGRPVVLIHGFATPSLIWDNNFNELVNAGFRVLRYDHFGRGFSDRPDAVYDRDLYDRQLLELLQKLNISMPVHLVGLSMGGAVAVTFADRHAEMAASLCLIAPAGYPVREPLTVKLARLPLLGDYLMTVAGDPFVLAGVKRAFVHPDSLPQFEAKFRVQMRYRGFSRALLSTMRHMNMHNLGESYERIGRQNKPLLLIWGREDSVLPFANSEKIKNAVPRTEFHAVEGAGHNVNYENPEVVNPILRSFLQNRAGA